MGPDDIEEVLEGASKVLVGRGKNYQTYDLKKKDVDWDEMVKKSLGPSGGLRAPVARSGKTVLVGFCEEAWASHFG